MRKERGRYCRVTTCPNFKGAKKSTPIFNAPAYDPPLRDKWVRWLRTVEPKFDERIAGFTFTLCDLHFDTDDMRRCSGQRYRLVPGTIPKYYIPHPDPLAAVIPESGDTVLNLDKTKPTTENASTENATQVSEQTIEVDFDKDMNSSVPEEPKRPSYCTKCIHVNVDVQSLKVKLAKSENRVMNQKSIIDSLRNMLSELKSAQRSEIPKTDVCSICNEKVPAGSLYEHLCLECDGEDGSIKCAYCERSFKATIALTEHLKLSHMIKSLAVSCDECDQHYAMEKLLHVHVMAKHKRKLSKLAPTPAQSERNSPIPMTLSDNESIELVEPEQLEEPEPVETNIEEIIEILESPNKRTTTNHQMPQRMTLEGESRINSGYSYLSDGNNMPELFLSANEQKTNQANNKPQLRRIKIIKKKNATESMSVSGNRSALDAIPKITVAPLSIPHKDSPLLKPYKCGYSCGESFALAQELNLHMKQNHGIAGHGIHLECYQCSERFVKISELRKHLSTMHEIKASKDKSRLCDQCGLICKTEKLLKKHYESHFQKIKTTNTRKQIKSLNGMPYCDICKISFNSRVTYWRHSLGHRDDKGKKYACQHCPLRCVDKRQLMDHMGKHTGEKPYQCDYCVSKKFSYKGDLKRHLRTAHFGDKVYGCEIPDCDERFKYHKELQTHLRIHHA